jgi:hypothetical protein
VRCPGIGTGLFELSGQFGHLHIRRGSFRLRLGELGLEQVQAIAERIGTGPLEGASLGSAHLERASLSEAHLEGAILYRAHLEGAIFGGAHLEGVDLGGAYLEGVDLSRAIGDAKTQLPDSVARPAGWPPYVS